VVIGCIGRLVLDRLEIGSAVGSAGPSAGRAPGPSLSQVGHVSRADRASERFGAAALVRAYIAVVAASVVVSGGTGPSDVNVAVCRSGAGRHACSRPARGPGRPDRQIDYRK
jgi:hypothetical protein